MKKIQKNKKGFTLIEMVLVIAIILILAAVLIISISGYIEKANSAKSAVEEHNDSLDEAMAQIP